MAYIVMAYIVMAYIVMAVVEVATSCSSEGLSMNCVYESSPIITTECLTISTRPGHGATGRARMSGPVGLVSVFALMTGTCGSRWSCTANTTNNSHHVQQPRVLAGQ